MQNSRPYEWSSFSGGAKFKAFKHLKILIDGNDFRKKFIDVLCEDIISGNCHYSIKESFDEVLEIVYDELPIEKCWPMIISYLEKLFEPHTNKIDSFEFPIKENHDASLPPIYRLLLKFLDHNVNLISQGSYLVFQDLFENVLNQNLFPKLISSSNDNQLVLLLSILSEQDDRLIISNKKELKNIFNGINSNHFYVRWLIHTISKRINFSYKIRTRNKSIPLVYRMELSEPQSTRIVGSDETYFFTSFPDTSNPFGNNKYL